MHFILKMRGIAPGKPTVKIVQPLEKKHHDIDFYYDKQYKPIPNKEINLLIGRKIDMKMFPKKGLLVGKFKRRGLVDIRDVVIYQPTIKELLDIDMMGPNFIKCFCDKMVELGVMYYDGPEVIENCRGAR